MITYKFRMYPNKEQRERLDFSLDLCRQTYNMLLEELNNQTKISKKEIQHKIVELKSINPELRGVYSKTLQYECYRLFSNLAALRELKKHGNKVGRLRFKGKDWFKTMNYNQSGFCFEMVKPKKGILHLSKIGNIKVKAHRPVENNIKQVTIKKSLGKWYAMIISNAVIKRTHGSKVVGIDLGINNYIVDSEGIKTENPKTLDKYSQELKAAQQDLSRKKKGSHNRQKAKFQVAKIYEKIENRRNDFLHKLSSHYVKNCKIIAIEDLSTKEMMESAYNAKNIADASWGKFTQFLAYKAESAGCKVIKVNPQNTTKICSGCGNLQEIPLWIRTYKCNNCGLEIDRDYNAAINIKNRAIGSERAYAENAANTPMGASCVNEARSHNISY